MNGFKDVPMYLLSGKEIPEGLRELPQPPKQLYVQGALPKDGVYLTVVGSRKYSSYGKEACEIIIEGLKDYPFVIVSGLALGMDSIAHKKAIKVGLKTIAIPGSGLDPKVIAPRTNYILAKEILENGGVLMSEYTPTTQPAKHTFPRRNRIMAGLSQAVLIIEATKKSGTLITARMALDYNKTIFAVPGPITSRGSEGTNWLIKEGATPVSSADDILEVLGFEHTRAESNSLDLSKEEEKFLELISEFKDKTTLLKKGNWNITQFNVIATSLELKGIIKEEGEHFTRY